MKKNVLLFIIDSLNFSRLKNSDDTLMPYLDQLSKQGVCCENMFSQAPYTEAAVMDIYCGQNVLDKGGYLKRFKYAKKTIFEAMKENGYITYYNSYQPQCYPSTLRRGIDYVYYNVGFDLGALWSYRLYHYSSLLNDGELTEDDKNNLIDIFDDNFEEWLLFVRNLMDDDESCSLIRGNDRDYNPQVVYSQVENEYSQYNDNKLEYIYSVLRKGLNHPIYKIPAYVQNNKIKDRSKLNEITELFKPLLKDIRRLDLKLNVANNQGFTRGIFRKFKEFCKKPSKTSYKNFLKSLYIVANVLVDLDIYQRIGDNLDEFKNAPSAKMHIDHYIKWATRNNTEPHFACIHVDDIHNPEEFFTYDSEDLDLLKREKESAQDYLNHIRKDYKGSITHDLSLKYIDSVIKYLVDAMKAKNIFDNTIICITADHGFSFAGYPLRDSFVTNLYLENYRVPFVVVNSGLPAKRIDKICITKDIPSTIIDIAEQKSDPSFVGHSILSDYQYERSMIEYCGGGCPDLTRRELKIASFDSHYFVGSLCSLKDDFEWTKVTEVYDLIKDPYQLNNIRQTVDKDTISKYYYDIKNRHDELNKDVICNS